MYTKEWNCDRIYTDCCHGIMVIEKSAYEVVFNGLIKGYIILTDIGIMKEDLKWI